MSISAVSLPSVQGSAIASLGPSPNLSNAAAANVFSPKLSSLSGSSSCFRGLVLAKKNENGFVASASSNDTVVAMPLNGVLFQPFEEVKKDEFLIPITPHVSIARQKFSQDCEAAVNEQIK